MNLDISDQFIDPQISKIEKPENFTTPFGDVTKSQLFKYIVIIVIFFAVFNRLNIGLNIVFGFTLAIILILYLNYKNIEDKKKETVKIDEKKNILRPKSKLIDKYDNMINFLFSIQEFYSFSPLNYENLVDNLEDFLMLYEDTIVDPINAGTNYELAVNKKSNALNALHNIIYSTEVTEGKYYITKINDALDRLSFVLSAYLDIMYEVNKRYIATYGMNINTKIIESDANPKPVNYYYGLDEDLSKKVSMNLY